MLDLEERSFVPSKCARSRPSAPNIEASRRRTREGCGRIPFEEPPGCCGDHRGIISAPTPGRDKESASFRGEPCRECLPEGLVARDSTDEDKLFKSLLTKCPNTSIDKLFADRSLEAREEIPQCLTLRKPPLALECL